MALPPQSNQAFLREVDEELRRDQLVGVWQRHGRAIVVGVVVLLVALSGVLIWQHSRERTADKRGEQLLAVYDSLAHEDTAAAQKAQAA